MVKFLSRLPMRALYAFSAFLYFLAYYIVRHRHGVISEQISKVFPASSAAERVAIHKRFLRNFCDVMVEVLKSASMTAAEMTEHVRILNLSAAREYLVAGQSVMFVTSHLCNWEWLLQAMSVQLGYPLDAAYKPLHDAWAERLMLAIRSRFGARLVPAKDLLADVFEQIVRRGIEKGVFAEVEPKLVALNALFLCHLWSMHARALRSITNDINEFFEMQSRIVLQGLLTREPVAAKRAAVAARRTS
jgi:KDO2-lipid IV(A) lauroyltransferase